MSTLQVVVDSLRTDIDMIIQDRVVESEVSSTELGKDTEMDALFATSEIQPPPP